jgi:hypothetical protein
MKFTNNQWAVIFALRAEPDYRFKFPEKATAETLVNRGLFRSRGNGQYRISNQLDRYVNTLRSPDHSIVS